MDSLYSQLRTTGVDECIIDNFHQFIKEEQYDTDSIAIDISDIGKNGNILQYSGENTKLNQTIVQFFEASQSMLYFFFYHLISIKNMNLCVDIKCNPTALA